VHIHKLLFFWTGGGLGVGLPAENKSLIKGKHIIIENIRFIFFAGNTPKTENAE
jgi:hypothetical protein